MEASSSSLRVWPLRTATDATSRNCAASVESIIDNPYDDVPILRAYTLVCRAWLSTCHANLLTNNSSPLLTPDYTCFMPLGSAATVLLRPLSSYQDHSLRSCKSMVGKSFLYLRSILQSAKSFPSGSVAMLLCRHRIPIGLCASSRLAWRTLLPEQKQWSHRSRPYIHACVKLGDIMRYICRNLLIAYYMSRFNGQVEYWHA